MLERLGVLEEGHRPIREHSSASVRWLSHPHDALRVRIGQGPQEQSVDDAEHRGVGADAEGEGKEHGEGESALGGEPPRRGDDIPKQCIHMDPRPASGASRSAGAGGQRRENGRDHGRHSPAEGVGRRWSPCGQPRGTSPRCRITPAVRCRSNRCPTRAEARRPRGARRRRCRACATTAPPIRSPSPRPCRPGPRRAWP